MTNWYCKGRVRLEDYIDGNSSYLAHMSFQNRSTRFCVATPTGRGAVATVAVVGDECIDIVNRVFKPKRKNPISDQDIGSIVYGNWRAEQSDGEDLVVCPIDTDRIDIHCHGGDLAIKVISNSLAANGAMECDPSEFTSHIIKNRYFADLQIAITQAATMVTAKLLWDQPLWHEKFLRKVASHIENCNSKSACKLIGQFLQWQVFGMRIIDGWSVSLCGHPNAGKSSLANALLGFDRAIVHDVAGTTRDAVESKTTFGGWPVRLIDTAGIRSSSNTIEQQGIEQAKQKTSSSDFVVLVVDSINATDEDIADQVTRFEPDIVVANKCDLRAVEHPQIDMVASATQGQGVEQLIKLLTDRIAAQAPESSQAFPVSVYQVTSLAAMRQYVESCYWQDAKNLLAQLQMEVD